MDDLTDDPSWEGSHMVIVKEEAPGGFLEEYDEVCDAVCPSGPEERRKRPAPVHSRVTDKRFQCRVCFYSTNDSSNYNKHIKIHQSRKDFQCPKCSFSCSDLSNLKKHIVVHTDEKPFKCALCDYSCKLKCSIRIHLARHYSPNNEMRKLKTYRCGQCDNTYMRPEGLSRHLKVHNENFEKKHSCPDCSKRFRYKDRLRQHYRVHTGEKPFACALCPFLTACKQRLNGHMTNKHTDARPFRCSECDWSFKTELSLRLHRGVHTGVKPYSCQFCSYRNMRSYEIKKHTARMHKERAHKTSKKQDL